MKKYGMVMVLMMMLPHIITAGTIETDTIETSEGPLVIGFIGHGSVMFVFKHKQIHVDPFGTLTDYSRFKPADLILITHEHQDHFDKQALKNITGPSTEIVAPETACNALSHSTIMKNGDTRVLQGISIHAVPAYNLVHKRDDGTPYHPKGKGNGYVITFGDKRVYIAGDTENIPEMDELDSIDIAFLPMNLPYTMTPEMVADAVGTIKPSILYPYHFGTTDTKKLTGLLKSNEQIEVRIRRMQ